MRDLRAFAWSMSRPPPGPKERGGVCVSCGGGTYKGRPACSKCLLAQSRAEAPEKKPGRPLEELARHRAGDHSLCNPERAGHGVCSECGKTVQVTASSAPPDRRRCRDCRLPPRTAAPRICVLCGESYVPKPQHRAGQRFCSKSCTTAWRNGSRPPYRRYVAGDMPRKLRQDRIRKQRRRETWDGVTDAEILERDHWRCGICRKPIGKDFKWPDPRSKSIDHIAPISKGGDDTAANKRAAHLGCNCGRAARCDQEQLAMIG